MRRLLVGLLAVLVLASASASWTAVYLLNAASESRQEQAERAEQRTEQLVDLLVEGRDEWGPALDESLRLLTQLCDADPDCDH